MEYNATTVTIAEGIVAACLQCPSATRVEINPASWVYLMHQLKEIQAKEGENPNLHMRVCVGGRAMILPIIPNNLLSPSHAKVIDEDVVGESTVMEITLSS